MRQVIAVVVTHDRLDKLRQCIGCLRAQTAPCDVLVVDNASADGTAAWLAEQEQQWDALQVLTLAENTGGAGGFNSGMRRAAEAGYDYIWIMDDDCLPKPDALEKLLEADALLGGPESYGFLSSVVLWTDGRGCQMNQQGIEKNYYEQAALLQAGIIRVFQATFVSLLFPARVVRRFGLPIRDYFIWGDDIEYTHRITMRGGERAYLVGKSQVVHAMANNVGSNVGRDDISRLDRYRISFRNEFYSHRKEGVRGLVHYCGRRVKDFLRILFQAKDHRLRRFGALFAGICQGLVFNPKVEYVEAK